MTRKDKNGKPDPAEPAGLHGDATAGGRHAPSELQQAGPEQTFAEDPTRNDFPIVGIGASAGGLEALDHFQLWRNR